MTLTSQISTHHMPEGGKLLLQFKDFLCLVHEPNLFCQLTQTSAISTKNLSTITHYNRFTYGLQAGTENPVQTLLVSYKRTWTQTYHLHIPAIIDINIIFEESLYHQERPWKIIKYLYQKTGLLRQFEPRIKKYNFLIRNFRNIMNFWNCYILNITLKI
jgi:hypothetical protein